MKKRIKTVKIFLMILLSFQFIFATIQKNLETEQNQTKQKLLGPLTEKLLTDGNWVFLTGATNQIDLDGVPIKFSTDGKLNFKYGFKDWKIREKNRLEIINPDTKEIEVILDYDENYCLLFNPESNQEILKSIWIGQAPTRFSLFLSKHVQPKRTEN